jgi:spore germination cell wall hydrolase CwlJ-like protein
MRKIILGILVSTFVGCIVLSSVVNSADSSNSIITEARADSLDKSLVVASVLPSDIKNDADIKPKHAEYTTPKPKRVASAKPSELECMARAMYQEANDEGEIGLESVGHVILNRIANGDYPKTVCGVVYQKTGGLCQFSFVCTGGRGMPAKREKELEVVAARVINGETHDQTGGALYFNNTPFHNKYMAFIKKIGGHWFYKDRA